jgi:hypothetical protein
MDKDYVGEEDFVCTIMTPSLGDVATINGGNNKTERVHGMGTSSGARRGHKTFIGRGPLSGREALPLLQSLC